jgi:hypothetical protein
MQLHCKIQFRKEGLSAVTKRTIAEFFLSITRKLEGSLVFRKLEEDVGRKDLGARQRD